MYNGYLNYVSNITETTILSSNFKSNTNYGDFRTCFKRTRPEIQYVNK